MDIGVIIDPAYKALCQQLAEEIDNRIYSLATGSATQTINDMQTVAEKYAAGVSYIQALNFVIELCKDLERKRYGARPGEKDE